jgi:tetratricopeptide (TPR) repeat protein
MKTPVLLAIAALAMPASLLAAPAPTVETGYARGSLAVAAIERGDWARAERLLTGPHVDANDPARLINLGQVYWATGRQGEALSAWRRALASDRNFEVETMGGRMVSTQELARQALASHPTGLQSATR